MWKYSTIFLLTALFAGLTFCEQAIAQTSLSSPYSAFGLGNLSNVSNVRNRSMGGIGIAVRDRFTVNISNPASYSAFDSTSFVFEGGVAGHNVTLKTNALSENYSSASMTHLLFGFPVTNWWRSSFGLLPYSAVGYNVNDFDFSQQVGNTRFIFEGEGGLSQAFWGNSFKPHKSLSLGVNASYIFGTIDKIQRVTFPDSANLISTLVNDAVSISDLYYDFGAQFHKKINKLEMVIGATYNPKTALNARRNNMVRSYLGELSGVPLVIDTISIIADQKGTVTIPEGFGLGLSFAKKTRWMVGAEYRFEGWENYRSFNQLDSLTNRKLFRLGGYLTPNPNSLSYFQRIEYRLGANYSQSYLNLRNEQINGFGITFGVGLPIIANALRRTRSMINIGVEAGQRGTLANDLIQENYLNVYVSVSIYEWWFFKRRYQ